MLVEARDWNWALQVQKSTIFEPSPIHRRVPRASRWRWSFAVLCARRIVVRQVALAPPRNDELLPARVVRCVAKQRIARVRIDGWCGGGGWLHSRKGCVDAVWFTCGASGIYWQMFFEQTSYDRVYECSISAQTWVEDEVNIFHSIFERVDFIVFFLVRRQWIKIISLNNSMIYLLTHVIEKVIRDKKLKRQ